MTNYAVKHIGIGFGCFIFGLYAVKKMESIERDRFARVIYNSEIVMRKYSEICKEHENSCRIESQKVKQMTQKVKQMTQNMKDERLSPK